MTDPNAHSGPDAFHTFMIEFMGESDRACVILASAEMEVRLELLFTKFLKTNSELRKDLFSFAGPLGSFSARTKMAYALGLITKDFHQILDLFRSIRNKVVHKGVHVSIDESDLKQSRDELVGYFMKSERFRSWVFKPESLTDSQAEFRSALSFIMVMIEHTTSQLSPLNIVAHSCDPEQYIGDLPVPDQHAEVPAR